MIPLLPLTLAAAGFAQSLEDARVPSAPQRPAVVEDARALGAWFRKVTSVESTGDDAITAEGVLPQFHADASRMHSPAAGEGAYTEGALDSPGVYLGAHADRREIDAGLKWDHRYDSTGRDTGAWAWRLFWRTAAPGANVWRNPKPGSAQDIYFEPGQRFAMTLAVRKDGTARLDARGAGDGAPAATAVFPIDGFWDATGKPLPRTFKRVHSIDQFGVGADGKRAGLEGRPAVPTRAFVEGGRWESVGLLGAKPGPLTGARAVEVRGPDSSAKYRAIYPSSDPDAAGGEDIVIVPPRP